MHSPFCQLYGCIIFFDIGDGSGDIQRILSAIGESDLTETLALQEAIMQSQMATVTTSGTYY